MTTVLRLDHVNKAFGPVKVIQDVSVDVIPGKVRVLLGENRAGKSTLIKMMSGIYHPDSGSVIIDGNLVELPTVKAAEAQGVATIHQELNLVPQMSVAENIMLGRTPSRGGLVSWGPMRDQARAALTRRKFQLLRSIAAPRAGMSHPLSLPTTSPVVPRRPRSLQEL